VRVGNPNETVAAAPPAMEVVVTAAAPASAGGDAADGESIYNGACVACHAAGVAGAPKLEDQAAWAPRIALGEDALVMSVVNGKGAMPPKGGNPSLSEDQIRAAVKYILGQSGGSAAAPGNTDKAQTVAATASAPVAGKAAQPMTPSASSSAETSGGEAAGKPGDQVYNMGCVACHATGAANAPKLTDKAAWETRAGAGAAALLSSVLNGKGAMPPKGGIPTLTESDLRNAVRYMLGEAGVEAGS
jgi:cytochrome c5